MPVPTVSELLNDEDLLLVNALKALHQLGSEAVSIDDHFFDTLCRCAEVAPTPQERPRIQMATVSALSCDAAGLFAGPEGPHIEFDTTSSVSLTDVGRRYLQETGEVGRGRA